MFYFDRYLGELVKEKNVFAAPERYYEYREGIDGVATETYIVSYNPLTLINFSYSINDEEKLISIKRNKFFKRNNLSENSILYAYTVPSQWYKRGIQNNYNNR